MTRDIKHFSIVITSKNGIDLLIGYDGIVEYRPYHPTCKLLNENGSYSIIDDKPFVDATGCSVNRWGLICDE